MYSLIERLKMLLGIEFENKQKDFILGFAIETSSDIIKNYCNITSIPIYLENTLLNMAVSFYRCSDFGNEFAQNTAVSAIKEGDISINFQSKNNNFNSLLEDYKLQLEKYRKAGWN